MGRSLLMGWHSILINEWSQKDTKPLFDLIYDIHLTHMCTWSPSTSLPSVWFQYRVVCWSSITNTSLLGTYFTDSCFISVLHCTMCIYQCVVSNLLHTLISFLSLVVTYYMLFTYIICYTSELIRFFKLWYKILNRVFLRLSILHLCICSQTFVISWCILPL
jgi:hypothetical protein